jgi:hypothetical protein
MPRRIPKLEKDSAPPSTPPADAPPKRRGGSDRATRKPDFDAVRTACDRPCASEFMSQTFLARLRVESGPEKKDFCPPKARRTCFCLLPVGPIKQRTTNSPLCCRRSRALYGAAVFGPLENELAQPMVAHQVTSAA